LTSELIVDAKRYGSTLPPEPLRFLIPAGFRGVERLLPDPSPWVWTQNVYSDRGGLKKGPIFLRLGNGFSLPSQSAVYSA